MTTPLPDATERLALGAEQIAIEPSDERFSPQYLLNLLMNVGTLLSTTYDRRSTLSRQQTRLIGVLLTNDGQTQTDLANALEIHKVSVGIYISELEALGLIERRQHPTDRRAKCIFLTPRLHAIKHRGVEIYAAIHHIATKGIDRKAYLGMLETITLMRENLNTHDHKERQAAEAKNNRPSE
ncbi:MAG: MarR family transcriptional regulator [Pseudomonadota bacterium]